MKAVVIRPAVLAFAGAVCATGLVGIANTASAAPALAVARCGNHSLAVTRSYTQGGAGHSWLALIYRNVTSHTCTVSGYPGVDAIKGNGAVLTHAKRTKSGYGGGGPLRTVAVARGAYASASVEWLNFNGATGGACRHSAAIDTIVANTSRIHRLAVSVSVCGLQVHPTVAGTPQYPHYGPAQLYWLRGSKVDAAGMNYYFLNAEQQLKTAKAYPTQVAELAQLSSFPDTGLTAKQIKQARADVRDLDSFFATPGLYS
ncbi:DUF4232 domain-containing protein [uncultured Jatrophihabitans sp.]|uniref:DUF4232 domain-containing protein n=1 Tax=uncultured Jatrophihabitans sp. TaxID=1610747 RepID=UPI0035CB1A30